MTLYETIDLLKKIALKHPNIGSASEGNIYEYMNANPSVKYGVFFITQGTHSQDEMFNHFEFTLFYVDRLVDDMEENRLQIQSIGKEILSNILTFFCEEFDAECENISFQPFTQRFVDETAGIYSTITIDVPKDVICPEEYWNEDWKVPVIVIRNQDKRVVFTENGTYTIDYDPNNYTGLGTVEVNVNIDVDSYYNNGYNQGKTDGISEQKSKLESINITENGTYTKEDGYSHIEVNVPDLNGSYDEGYAEGERVGYGQGKTDGINEQKSKLETISITENGTYTKEDGYNHIEVNVPDLNGSYNEGYEQGHTEGYNEGKTDGVNEQKGKLSQIRITENGTYAKEDGYSEVVVDVPDLNGSYDEGYSQGQADAVANAKTLEVTENGQYGDGKTLYKAINVNVIPKINIQEAGINFAYSSFTEVPEWADFKDVTNMTRMFYICSNLQTIPLLNTSNVTNMTYMFYRCSNLKTIQLIDTSNVTDMSHMFDFCYNLQTIPLLNTSNATNMAYMFNGCSNLQTIPLIDTSKVTNITYMFNGCSNLQTIPLLNTSNVTNMSSMFESCSKLQTIPQINTSNVTNMNYMFAECGNLQTIPQINTSNVTNMNYMFAYCSNLRTLPELDASKVISMINYFRNGGGNLTDVGGWKNLKTNWNDNYGLKLCPNLTYQSCINILNGLYDFVGNGETPNSRQGKLKVHKNFLTTVGGEISIGTSRGWTITA